MKDNTTGKDKEFYERGKAMFDRIQPLKPKESSTPPPAVIERWKRRIEEFKIKSEAEPDDKIAAFWLSCYEGYVAHFAKDKK